MPGISPGIWGEYGVCSTPSDRALLVNETRCLEMEARLLAIINESGITTPATPLIPLSKGEHQADETTDPWVVQGTSIFYVMNHSELVVSH